MQYHENMTIKEINTGNAYERSARWSKALTLYAFVPGVDRASKPARKRCASVLRSWSQADRDAFAKFAGVKSPSVKTWEMLTTIVEGK